jgi:hypothetical protein
VSETKQLLEVQYRNTKEYWKLLKSAGKNQTNNICLAEFADFFKEINCPSSEFFTADEDIQNTVIDYHNSTYMQTMFDELNSEI